MAEGNSACRLLPEISQRLDLHLMVEDNTAPLRTNFTVPVDHYSARTGITAQERATTILAILDPGQQTRATSSAPGTSFR